MTHAIVLIFSLTLVLSALVLLLDRKKETYYLADYWKIKQCRCPIDIHTL